jgi:hypothetical protein
MGSISFKKMIAAKRAWGKRGLKYSAGRQRLALGFFARLTPRQRRTLLKLFNDFAVPGRRTGREK